MWMHFCQPVDSRIQIDLLRSIDNSAGNASVLQSPGHNCKELAAHIETSVHVVVDPWRHLVARGQVCMLRSRPSHEKKHACGANLDGCSHLDPRFAGPK